MDSLVSTAARALASGDPLGALRCVALRGDAPALALRGIAMAQLGELARARTLLRRAARAFRSAEPVARARCVTAEAEVALAARDLSGPPRALEAAVAVLERRGDRANALLGRLVALRRSVLLGRVDDAERALGALAMTGAPSRLLAVAELVAADIAQRRLRSSQAEQALSRAYDAALRARIPALVAEVERARERLEAPVALLSRCGVEQSLALADVERLLRSGELVVDACRRELRSGEHVVRLTTRPVLFALAEQLARCWPAEATREQLIVRAFGVRVGNETHRVRLRVEIGRLRRLLGDFCGLRATARGFALEPRGDRRVMLLLPPAPGEASAVLALLRAGDAWSTSALAAALGRSQRTVQRALGELERAGTVRSVGRGRGRRWVAPPAVGFATTLLLVAPAGLG